MSTGAVAAGAVATRAVAAGAEGRSAVAGGRGPVARRGCPIAGAKATAASVSTGAEAAEPGVATLETLGASKSALERTGTEKLTDQLIDFHTGDVNGMAS